MEGDLGYAGLFWCGFCIRQSISDGVRRIGEVTVDKDCNTGSGPPPDQNAPAQAIPVDISRLSR